jgi:general secretion pathway protein L
MTTSATRSASTGPGAGALLPWLGARLEAWRARLAPADPVLVRHVDGSRSVWRGSQRLGDVGAGKVPGFVAVEIPDDLLLHRTLDLPRLAQADADEAVQLEVRGNSPFAADDMVWGATTRELESGRRRADIVIASRRQVAAFIETTCPDLAAAGVTPEAWALAGLPAPVVIRGFGEQGRLQHGAARARWDGLLLLLAGLLALFAALTPTLQLRMRALEAVSAFEALSARVAPLVRKRDEVAALNESLRLLDVAAADRVDVAGVMEYLTRVLPDDTYLYSLDIRKSKITAAGHTVDAAALLQRLSSDPRLKDVRAPSAVTRAPGATKEAFTVEFTLAPPAPVSAPAAAPEPAAALPAGPQASASAPGAQGLATAVPASGAVATASAPAAAAAPAAPASAAAAKPGASPFVIGGSVR